jgi:hypothetical protein
VRIGYLIFAAVIASLAAAQQPSNTACIFDGLDTNSKLAETLKTGDPVVVNRVEGDWTCGYLVGRKGSGPGWVRSSEIRLIDSDPTPPLAAWAGTWVQGENRITIQNSKTPHTLHLGGEAYWRGIGDNVHSGEFSGDASPVGNQLHVEDDACHIDLALIGKYLLANDNNSCGGLNVRFWGVWKHSRKN